MGASLKIRTLRTLRTSTKLAHCNITLEKLLFKYVCTFFTNDFIKGVATHSHYCSNYSLLSTSPNLHSLLQIKIVKKTGIISIISKISKPPNTLTSNALMIVLQCVH